MILNASFAVKCLFMVHSLRLKSKALSFALFCTLGVAAMISNCCWFAFMLSRVRLTFPRSTLGSLSIDHVVL